MACVYLGGVKLKWVTLSYPLHLLLNHVWHFEYVSCVYYEHPYKERLTSTITAAAARNAFAVKPQGQAARGMAYKLKSHSGAKKRYAFNTTTSRFMPMALTHGPLSLDSSLRAMATLSVGRLDFAI